MHKFHSLSVYAGISGSLLGTASWASDAVSSSYAVTASYVSGSSEASVSSSYALTSSYAETANTLLGSVVSASYATTAATASYFSGSVLFEQGLIVTGSTISNGGFTGSLQGTASWADNVISSSYAVTASYSLNGGSGDTFPYSGSAVITGSLIVTGSTQLTGAGVTGSVRLANAGELVLGTLGTRLGASYFYFASPNDNNTIAPVGSIGGGYIYSNNLGRAIAIGPASWEFDSFSTNHRTGLGISGTMRGRAPGITGSGDASINMLRIDGKIGDSSTFLWNSSAPISALNIITQFSASDASTGQFTGLRVHPEISGSTLQSNLVLLDVGTQGITKFSISGSGDVTSQRLVATQITSSLFGTSSWAENSISSSFAQTANTLLGSVQSASYAVTSSYATTAVSAETASYFNGYIQFPTGLEVTGSLVVTGSANIIGPLTATEITSSLFGTASWAQNAVSSSFATSASYAENAPAFPYTGSAIISGSLIITASSPSFVLTNGTTRLTASVGGGNAIWDATNAFLRFRAGGNGFYWNGASLIPEAGGKDIGTAGAPWRSIYVNNISGSLALTGSLQMSDGGITGSLLGTSSWASNAVSASFFEGYALFENGLDVTGSLTVTGSIITTGSIQSTNGFTGSLLGTSSWASDAISSSYATTASAADSITFVPATASFATTASYAQTSNTASYALSASIAQGLIGYASFPQGLTVTGSTLSTGGFTGSLQGTASWATDAISASLATTASAATSITFVPATASYATTAATAVSASYATTAATSTSSSFATTAGTASFFSGFVAFPNGLDVTGSLYVTGSQTIVGNSVISGSLNVTNGITGSLEGTASYATAGGNPFPYTGNPEITGSLLVTGSIQTTGSVNIAGTLTATAKSFAIDHQTQPGKKLVYGVVEGPEHSVVVRGTLVGTNMITLPDEWEWLVDMNTITVQLTPVGTYQRLYVDNINGLHIKIQNEGGWNNDVHCYYLVQATRKDIEPLQTVV